MFKQSVIVLDIVALLLTGVWIIRAVILGLTAVDLIYNYIYSIVVLFALLLSIVDNIIGDDE